MRSTLSFLALAASASAATVSIDVGEDGALKFSPNSMTAAVGDTLEFHFYSGSGGHSVVSSSFTSPCQPASDAFFSGYITGDDEGDMTFVVPVTSTDPIWFYCSLDHHCQSGMVGVVNPPSDHSIADYAMAAQSVSEASAPAALQGGTLTSINPSAATSSSSVAAISSSSVATMSSSSAAATSSSAAMSSAMPTTTASSSSAATTSMASSSTSSSASTSATAVTTSAGAGNRERSDVGVLMGLAVFAAGLVALMA